MPMASATDEATEVLRTVRLADSLDTLRNLDRYCEPMVTAWDAYWVRAYAVAVSNRVHALLLAKYGVRPDAE